jgi:hypothetical protein
VGRIPVSNAATVADRGQDWIPERTRQTMVRVDRTKKVPRIETPAHLCRVAASIPNVKNNAGGTSQNTILAARTAVFPWDSAILLASFSGGAHT